ncbi:MAG TPA: hypothetical protein VFA78_03410, partial [Chloroflexota bacterium]|nr:hypothetical protein [Chloroflexota bacterium]
IFTYYRLQVSETLKGSVQPGAQVEVAVPGGSANGIRQVVPGAPSLETGGSYVLFLWTSRSGLTQVIGLSQGLFRMTKDSSGTAIVIRPASTELMVDRNGNVVTDKTTTLRWSDVRDQIRQTLGSN